MSIFNGLLTKIGIRHPSAKRQLLRVFLLDDDTLRHQWFASQFDNDHIDIAVAPAQAIGLLSVNSYDVIFLDHDLLPEHYHSDERDDERTGFAVAVWLASNPTRQSASSIVVHTRNAEGAMRMVEELRNAGRRVDYIPFTVLAPKIKNYRRG
ncbi:MAG: hypothetical protein M3430_13920 [Acidobacteriota bacterium]|nr:hypothetical protein [Acidobacteriota bacterium]